MQALLPIVSDETGQCKPLYSSFMHNFLNQFQPKKIVAFYMANKRCSLFLGTQSYSDSICSHSISWNRVAQLPANTTFTCGRKFTLTDGFTSKICKSQPQYNQSSEPCHSRKQQHRTMSSEFLQLNSKS